jgi:tetratricopeptide (TPR) repeat protein
MASCAKLDAARGARRGTLILFCLLLASLALHAPAAAQENPSDAARLAAAQKAFDSGHWEEAAKLSQGSEGQSPELDFLRGLALARQQQWNESRQAFAAGHLKNPNDPRFLVELAGIDYKHNDFSAAKWNLRRALRLGSRDSYTLDFLGTIYFVQGNLEAALKYWNAIDKPRLRNVAVQPPPRLEAKLLNRAVTFNAPQVLSVDALLSTRARLENPGIFSHERVELRPAGENFDATLHLAERNGWGDSKLEGAIALLSGVPYETVYPEVYNLGHRAMNFTSLLRWDSQKRRAFGVLSTPLFDDPARRLQIYFDARNENWNLSKTFFGGTVLGDLNLRRIAGGVELHSVMNGRWSWSTGMEVAGRSFRNVQGISTTTARAFFTDANSFGYWLRADRSLLRVPERRFTVDSSAEGRIGRTFAENLGAFGTVRGSLDAHWLPRASGDDYEVRARLRAGATLGRVPFDELFELGVERDNDLWLRGQAGTTGGRKGAAPLGRRYLLENWEIDKNVYSNGIFTVKLGPFFDTGATADSSGLFGSRRWLFDTGAQCKVRVLGSITVVLIYGRDLRGGRNIFYGTVLR